jgi:hypothetical protein
MTIGQILALILIAVLFIGLIVYRDRKERRAQRSAGERR